MRQRCAHAYGTRLERVLGTASALADLGRELLPHLYEREVEYLCREEFARTTQDILWRRTKLGLHLLNVDSSPLDRWLEAGGHAA
jgi:glycerol-3-phosphate dehydrogenase